MGKRKLNSLEDLGGFVFSTNESFDFDGPADDATPPPEEQYLEAHFSNKGRAGKVVTLIKGFVGSDDDLRSLAKHLKVKCGVGGAVKDGEIIIQGNFRDKIMTLLKEQGYHVKRIGG